MWTSFLDDYSVVHGKDMGEGRALTGITSIGWASTDGTGVTDTDPEGNDLINSTLEITSQIDPVDNLVHILAKMTADTAQDSSPPGGASATLLMWVQPSGADDKYFVDTLTISHINQSFTLPQIPVGTLHFSISSISASSGVDIYHMSSA